ncbi:GNAT family N-acetyltransferase [Kribbella qitaiheensis]|uniref:GNAT family N-acetyltransferase n=1 Tax=Kribbella qitaiheensis TaxID=1544730 RepID=UPI003D18BAD1
MELIVHPQYRRRGICTALLEQVYAAARHQHRSLIELQTVRALPGGIARDEAGYRYLTNRAHHPGMTSIRSRCRLAAPSPADKATLAEAWTHANSYSLIQWRDAAPEEIIKDIAALQSRLTLDAPTGNLAVEQQLYDTERVRRQEATEVGPRPPLLLNGSPTRRHRPNRRPHQTVIRIERPHPRPPTSHNRRARPPRPPPRAAREVGQPRAHKGPRASAAPHRRLERRGQHPHASGQRTTRLPPGRHLANLPTTGPGHVTTAHETRPRTTNQPPTRVSAGQGLF